MQQTTKYKLNLIEKDDVFSPDALKENTQKVESALAAEETARKAETAALSQTAADLQSRVTALEVHKIAIGKYSGSGMGKSQTISLSFTPAAVLVFPARFTTTGPALAVTGQPAYEDDTKTHKELVIVQGGFTVGCNITTYNSYLNRQGTFYYIAFA